MNNNPIDQFLQTVIEDHRRLLAEAGETEIPSAEEMRDLWALNGYCLLGAGAEISEQLGLKPEPIGESRVIFRRGDGEQLRAEDLAGAMKLCHKEAIIAWLRKFVRLYSLEQAEVGGHVQ